ARSRRQAGRTRSRRRSRGLSVRGIRCLKSQLGHSFGWGPVFSFENSLRGISMSTQPGPLSTAFPPSVEPYVDSKRAAEFLAFDSKTVQRLAREGKIPAHPVLGGSRSLRRTWRYKLSELDEWARAQRTSATAGSATSPKEK